MGPFFSIYNGVLTMSQAKSGDTVKIHYTGTLDDGTQFDSSDGRDPLEFEVGGGQVIPGFDSAVEGMAVGDKKASALKPVMPMANVMTSSSSKSRAAPCPMT
jgi:hypothetical protein